MKKVIVIGGGPAGMMAAITAADKYKVFLIERNEKLGKKLFITGKGRCNVTNKKDISDFFDYIPGNPEFLYSSLYTFTNENTIEFFNSRNTPLKTERGDRVFPKSDKSSDIIKALEKELEDKGVKIMLNSPVRDIKVKNNLIHSVILQNGLEIEGDYFIIATGGASYPQTGSTGDGYKFASKVGHKISNIKPALVPLEIEDPWVKNLQGLSLKNVELKIINSKSKEVYKDFGEMLFTHFGISGPIVLSSSRYVKENEDQYAVLNLKPALTFEELDKRIQKDFNKYINKDFKNSLNDLLPKKLIDTIIKLSNIPEDKKVNSITKEERRNLCSLIQNLKMKIKGFRPIKEAIVTSGGINVDEINPSNMQSKIIPNLHFAGEVIDVDGYTGGFNIQIAFSTGYLAGTMVGDK
ncbi:NAD(P)/FAD-dependent oxidoreductase [Clostridium cochlearium]|nr:NAD(P)/FAD-dependent oxidoreductase [Clostridium cochlearium]MBV1819571.1 NAD(P)/FAD-dependent oxidoreductase [Bacteroidales bacterium MSK.15.36]MBU5268813.1 NAD(P)/FAD-dependent oxidoreductase [Clostridium cochlearium]MCG4570885.1 NAD(P)/FAD-dependent oxidoreductase [Clostridium cochlearium]MCG4580806.1 NAD(P)/FAD-dependent oxidoreductase [Clostridium cochlearium]MCR1970618.1 NAD(P)/FAD-dependent oxidoreductase [Clostridium cochlearium]